MGDGLKYILRTKQSYKKVMAPILQSNNRLTKAIRYSVPCESSVK